ncbi:MAG: histidine phosphatase family protein [Acidobacteriota bacterium]
MQTSASQQILLIRHGETEWTLSGQHTGRTDIPLTDNGREQARATGRYLEAERAAGKWNGSVHVWTSPMHRAKDTCELAGMSSGADIDTELMEWNYGDYEGLTTAKVRETIPDWSVWTSPILHGESVEQVGARADRVIARAAVLGAETVLLFAHGHILRILAARWIGLPATGGSLLGLDPATISMLGYERQTRVIRRWNLVP